MTINPIQLTNPQAYSGGVDFTPLANLGEVYKKAQNERRLSDLGKQLAAGSTDYRTAAGQLAEMGDTNSMLKFIALAEQQRKEQLGLEASKNFGGFIAPLVGGAAAPQRASETIVDAPSARVAATELVPNPAADDPNAPIRTNPDGTIAGNMTAPRVPIARSMPAETSAPIQAVTPAPPLPQLTDFNDRFNAARPSGVAPAGAAAPPTPVMAGEPTTAAAAPVTAVSKPRAPLAATRLPGEPDFISAVPGALAALRNPYLPAEDKKIAEDIIKRGWDSATPTDKIRTLRAYKADANDPRTLLEIEKELVGKGATQVTIAGEKKYQQTVEEDLGKDFVKMQQAGRAASSTKTTLKLMRQAATDPRFDSGLLPEVTSSVKRGLSAMGVTDAGTALPNEVFDKLAKQQIIDIQEGKLGAGFSNTDLAFMEGSSANRKNTPAGNLAVIDIQEKTAERKQQVARMARDYANKHRDSEGNPKLDYNFYEYLDQWAEKNPLFPQGIPGVPPPAAAEPAAPAGAVPAALAAPAAPKIGEVQHGRPYLGGNPADPKSWGPRQ